MDGAALTTEALLWNAWSIDSARGIPTKKVSSFLKIYLYIRNSLFETDHF